jgi:hypothetical protein
METRVVQLELTTTRAVVAVAVAPHKWVVLALELEQMERVEMAAKELPIHIGPIHPLFMDLVAAVRAIQSKESAERMLAMDAERMRVVRAEHTARMRPVVAAVADGWAARKGSPRVVVVQE